MKTEEEIREKIEELGEESLEVLKDSHQDQDINGVNRGAVYGHLEALKWVIEDSEDKEMMSND